MINRQSLSLCASLHLPRPVMGVKSRFSSLSGCNALAAYPASSLVETGGVSEGVCASVSTATARAAFHDATSGSLVGALGRR